MIPVFQSLVVQSYREFQNVINSDEITYIFVYSSVAGHSRQLLDEFEVHQAVRYLEIDIDELGSDRRSWLICEDRFEGGRWITRRRQLPCVRSYIPRMGFFDTVYEPRKVKGFVDATRREAGLIALALKATDDSTREEQ